MKPTGLSLQKIFKFISLMILVGLLQSCAQLSELANVSKPSLSVVDMNITGLTLQDIELTADIEINNPNNKFIQLHIRYK